MIARPVILVLGGARSGKSRFALCKGAELGLDHLFLATAEPRDDDMVARIAHHRAERGEKWRTIEEPRKIAEVMRHEKADVVVIDCLTLWLANLQDDSVSANPEPAIGDLVSALAERRSAVVLVSNEVGSGIVPDNSLSRKFRDAAGLMNQRIAEVADEVYLLVAGQPLRVKGTP